MTWPTRTKNRLYSYVPALTGQGEVDIRELVNVNENPIELEVGFGRGRFLMDRAAALPGTRFLGFETRRKWVHVVAERAKKRQLGNIVVLHGDARSQMARLVPDASLARIFIHFPDPWWKARHEKRMVVCDALFRQMARLLADGGEIFVQTDVDFRKEAYKEMLSSAPDFAPSTGDGELDENPYGARSLREIQCIEAQLPIYRLLFKRAPRARP